MEQKYLNFLNDIRITTKGKQFKNATLYAKKHNVSKGVIIEMVKGGLLSKVGNAKGSIFKWNTIDPNILMAKELIKKCRERAQNYNALNNAKIEKSQLSLPLKPKRTRTKKVVEPIITKTTKKISLFWGLLKIEY